MIWHIKSEIKWLVLSLIRWKPTHIFISRILTVGWWQVALGFGERRKGLLANARPFCCSLTCFTTPLRNCLRLHAEAQPSHSFKPPTILNFCNSHRSFFFLFFPICFSTFAHYALPFEHFNFLQYYHPMHFHSFHSFVVHIHSFYNFLVVYTRSKKSRSCGIEEVDHR